MEDYLDSARSYVLCTRHIGGG